jgi:hypothetical protein
MTNPSSSMARFNRAQVGSILLFALIAIGGAQPQLKGDQITIHVAATIDQLTGDPSKVPMALAVGDTVTAEYVFDVADFTSSQTAGLGSQKLILSSTVLESNNSAGFALNDGLPVPPLTPRDTVLVSCATLTNVSPGCNTNRYPGNENLIWDPTLTLYADAGSLQTLSDVAAVSSLSSVHGTGTLLMEILKVDFAQASLERLLTIRATVTELRAIPEPSAILLATIAMASVTSPKIRAAF